MDEKDSLATHSVHWWRFMSWQRCKERAHCRTKSKEFLSIHSGISSAAPSTPRCFGKFARNGTSHAWTSGEPDSSDYEKQQFDTGKTSHKTVTLERKKHAPSPRGAESLGAKAESGGYLVINRQKKLTLSGEIVLSVAAHQLRSSAPIGKDR